MNNLQIAKTLDFLRPNAEWVLIGDDYSRIEWLDGSQVKPTIEEVESGFNELQNFELAKAAEAAAAKAALLEKLGITEEEAKLLLS